ncbi:hypothetical protein BJ165DRAFT_1402288 [Panaeolus papilionaceus]|nr:hypothetical protein BJ165DRAFT_1402288 [Panaeolus papilionaceus]
MADSEERHNSILHLAELALSTSGKAIDLLAEMTECRQQDEEDVHLDKAQLVLSLQALKTRVDERLDEVCWNMTESDLHQMNIRTKGYLTWKETFPSCNEVSSDPVWTQDMLCRHLDFLKDVDSGILSAHSWVNPFLYRVACLLPKDTHMVFGIEKEIQLDQVPPSDRSSHALLGYEERLVLVTSYEAVQFTLRERPPRLGRFKPKQSAVLYVAEVNAFEVYMRKYVPQALAEMYTCARITGKQTIRGVVTNGRCWHFLILTLNSMEEDAGGEFWESNDFFIGYWSRNDALYPEAISKLCSILTRWWDWEAGDDGPEGYNRYILRKEVDDATGVPMNKAAITVWMGRLGNQGFSANSCYQQRSSLMEVTRKEERAVYNPVLQIVTERSSSIPSAGLWVTRW